MKNLLPPNSLPLVSIFLPSFESGGAEKVVVQLANQFSAYGLSVDIICINSDGLLRQSFVKMSI